MVTAEHTRKRKARWYQERHAEGSAERQWSKFVKSAAPAARGLPDSLRAALGSLGPEGEYESWATEYLMECQDRGLIEQLEECGDFRRATMTGWGRAVLETLASADTRRMAETTEIGSGRSPSGAVAATSGETPTPKEQ